MKKKYEVLMALNLVRKSVVLPVAILFVAGITASAFGDGWVSTAGKFVNAVFFGLVLFGALMEPKYLTEEGKRVARAHTAD